MFCATKPAFLPTLPSSYFGLIPPGRNYLILSTAVFDSYRQKAQCRHMYICEYVRTILVATSLRLLHVDTPGRILSKVQGQKQSMEERVW